MKNNLTENNENGRRDFATVCLDSCRKLLDRIDKVKQAVLDEFHVTLDAHNQMLRLAVNEAEALAWQTGFPQLVFPTLATEKAQEVVARNTRQQSIQRTNSRFALSV